MLVAMENKNTSRRWIPFQYYSKKFFFRSFSSSLDAVDGGGGRQAQKFFYDFSCANCESWQGSDKRSVFFEGV